MNHKSQVWYIYIYSNKGINNFHFNAYEHCPLGPVHSANRLMKTSDDGYM